jgi:hypothetical protein
VGVLDKPLIIVKGFDVSSILPVAATRFSKIGRFTYGAYIDETFNGPTPGGVLLGDGAYQDGYDIVYVDFDNGVDYIQRNAYLLEKVIKWVNDNKTGSAPNKMMGLSFGGIMAQYALRDIEEAGSVANNPAYPHQVGLLITHDSPSQGANVPLSIQLLVRKLAGTTIRNPVPFSDDVVLTDRFPLLGKARDALLSPASQQLLRYQTTRPLLYSVGGFQYYGEVAAAQTSLYDSFQQEYQAKLGSAHVPVGTPGKPCRVVAVSNGTECGLTQPYGPYALLASLNYEGNYDNFGLLDVLRNVLLASPVGGFAVGLGIVSGPVGIIGVGLVSLFSLGLTGAYDLTAALTLRALPDQQAQRICDIFLQVNKRTRLFGLFRLQFDLLEYHGSSLASELPLDSGSGSIVSIADYSAQFGTAASAIPSDFIKATQFCFEPTYSALNITPSGTAALSAQYSADMPVGTPFANFRTATRQNESHVQYTDPNSSWMLKELRQTPQVLNCQSFCQSTPTITGPSAICGGGATFSINNLPTGTVVTWNLTTSASVTPKQYVGATYSPSFGGGNGAGGTLTATITSDCGSIVLTTPVYAGSPQTPLFNGPAELDCDTYAQTYYISNYDRNVNYTSQAGGAVNVKPVLSGVGSFQVIVRRSGQGYVNITATNSCGSVTNTLYVQVNECGNRYAAYPNPANDEVQIEQTDNAPASTRSTSATTTSSSTAPKSSGISTVRLYDSYGQLRLEQAGNQSRTVRLLLGQLPTGSYILHIVDGEGTVNHQQLMIKR